MILDRPPEGWRRPSIPDWVKAIALAHFLALRGFSTIGMTFAARDALRERHGLRVHYDHRPAVWERKFDTETDDTIPPANDPKYIEAITPEEHDYRTHGRGGEKRVTTLGSDSHVRAKAKRFAKDRDEDRPSRGRIPSRPFREWRSFSGQRIRASDKRRRT